MRKSGNGVDPGHTWGYSRRSPSRFRGRPVDLGGSRETLGTLWSSGCPGHVIHLGVPPVPDTPSDMLVREDILTVGSDP